MHSMRRRERTVGRGGADLAAQRSGAHRHARDCTASQAPNSTHVVHDVGCDRGRRVKAAVEARVAQRLHRGPHFVVERVVAVLEQQPDAHLLRQGEGQQKQKLVQLDAVALQAVLGEPPLVSPSEQQAGTQLGTAVHACGRSMGQHPECRSGGGVRIAQVAASHVPLAWLTRPPSPLAPTLPKHPPSVCTAQGRCWAGNCICPTRTAPGSRGNGVAGWLLHTLQQAAGPSGPTRQAAAAAHAGRHSHGLPSSPLAGVSACLRAAKRQGQSDSARLASAQAGGLAATPLAASGPPTPCRGGPTSAVVPRAANVAQADHVSEPAAGRWLGLA